MNTNMILKRVFGVLLIIISFSSCENNKEEVEKYKTQVEKLKKEISIKINVNDILRGKNEKNIEKINVLEEKAKSQFYLSKNEADFFIDEKMKFILNKKDFFDKIIGLSDFENSSFFSIYNHFFYFGDYYESNPIENEQEFIHYLMNKFDRRPSTIKSFFDKEIIKYLAKQIKRTKAYKKSGLEPRLKALINTYEDTTTNPDFVMLYNNFNSNEWGWDEDYLLGLPSETMKENLTEIYGEKIDAQKVFDSYGFWARRYHEGNHEVVYTILKEFDDNIKVEESINE